MTRPPAAVLVAILAAALPIPAFCQESVPISLGIVLDNSGGMREQQALMRFAVLSVLDAAAPQDEFFIFGFRETTYFDQGFTSDKKKLYSALQKTQARGFGAVRDAVSAAVDYAAQQHFQPKVALLVITRGDDTSSHETVETLAKKARDAGVAIYCVGLLKDEDRRTHQEAQGMLTALAKGSGGAAYFPKGNGDVDSTIRQFLHQLRDVQ